MQQQYGSRKAKKVFYASKNKGTISGVDEMSIQERIIKRLEEAMVSRDHPGHEERMKAHMKRIQGDPRFREDEDAKKRGKKGAAASNKKQAMKKEISDSTSLSDRILNRLEETRASKQTQAAAARARAKDAEDRRAREERILAGVEKQRAKKEAVRQANIINKRK